MTLLSRRALLGGAAGTLTGLTPLLQVRPGRASTPTFPRRLVVIVWPNGVVADSFWPRGDGRDYALPDDEDAPLAPLAPFREDVLLVGGLALQNLIDDAGQAGHAAFPYLLTGTRGTPIPACINPDCWRRTASGPSVDQVVADHIAREVRLPFHSLQLAIANDDARPGRFVSYRGPAIGDQPDAPAPEEDPVRLFDRLFGGRHGAGLDAATLARARRQRRSILDFVGGSLERMGRTMAVEDRRKLDGHLAAVRDIERELSAPARAPRSCAAGEPPAPKDYLQPVANPYFHEVVKLQVDMLVAALRCDLTRVATLAWARSHNNGVTFFWLGPELYAGDRAADTGGFGGPYRHHHEIAHNAHKLPGHRALKNRVDRWFFAQLAYLLQRMKEVPEGDGTMLDNSLVLFANCMADGGNHSVVDLPWVLAGRAGGALRPGRLIRRAGRDRAEPHNALLVSLCQAMGVPLEQFGDPRYGRGGLTALHG